VKLLRIPRDSAFSLTLDAATLLVLIVPLVVPRDSWIARR
jgi:hypothetical protein